MKRGEEQRKIEASTRAERIEVQRGVVKAWECAIVAHFTIAARR